MLLVRLYLSQQALPKEPGYKASVYTDISLLDDGTVPSSHYAVCT